MVTLFLVLTDNMYVIERIYKCKNEISVVLKISFDLAFK